MSNAKRSAFTWSVAGLLRGGYQQSEYGTEILPFTLLRPLDCVPVSIDSRTAECELTKSSQSRERLCGRLCLP
jgi:hypothetical protein